jgi:DMSO/TMAO reductase YedYZ heme-binding membrane subunit
MKQSPLASWLKIYTCSLYGVFRRQVKQITAIYDARLLATGMEDMTMKMTSLSLSLCVCVCLSPKNKTTKQKNIQEHKDAENVHANPDKCSY